MTKTISRKQTADLLNLKEYHISYIPQIYPDFPRWKRIGYQKLFFEHEILAFMDHHKDHDYVNKIMTYVTRYQRKVQLKNAMVYFGDGIDEQVMRFIRSKSIKTLMREQQ